MIESQEAAINYYERHIGDYIKDTAHLSLLEHGIYGRLMDVYYTRESAIPATQVERLIGARSKDERAALSVVLSEFFVVEADALRHNRCEREIARFQDKQSKASASAKARWAKTEPHCEGTANAMRSHTDGNAPSNQTPVTKEPPVSPQGGKRQSAVGMKAWLDAVKAAGESPVGEDDPVFAYAAEVGIPTDFLRLAWLEFKHLYTQPGAKPYRDWRSVFRKSVRGNWLKLWFYDPACSQYGLTTVGMQAQRANAERKAA